MVFHKNSANGQAHINLRIGLAQLAADPESACAAPGIVVVSLHRYRHAWSERSVNAVALLA